MNLGDKTNFKGDRTCNAFNSFKILFGINLIQTNYLVLTHVPDQIICVHHTSDSYVLDLRPKTNRFQLSIILLFWPNIDSNWTCKTILVVNRFNPSIQDFNCDYPNTSLWWIAFIHRCTSPRVMYSVIFPFMLTARTSLYLDASLSHLGIDGKDACASWNIKIL